MPEPQKIVCVYCGEDVNNVDHDHVHRQGSSSDFDTNTQFIGIIKQTNGLESYCDALKIINRALKERGGARLMWQKQTQQCDVSNLFVYIVEVSKSVFNYCTLFVLIQ